MIDSISLMVSEIYGSKVVEFLVYRDAIVQIVQLKPHILRTNRNVDSIMESKIIQSEITVGIRVLKLFCTRCEAFQ